MQGLADTFILLGLPFDSTSARQLNKDIFETIYFAALEESAALAASWGAYETFAGSPASKGRLQHDLWNVEGSARWDWGELRKSIAAHGLRNSLVTAPMPTASTSQILGHNECIEVYTSNLYTRRVLSGEFTIINPHLLDDLTALGLWTPELKNELVADRGSVQQLDVPSDLKHLYRTVWEIKQRCIIDMAADRGPYIDQSQSLNVHVAKPDFAKLTSLHFHGWKRGLKGTSYYVRTQAAADAIQFTVNQELLKKSRVSRGTSDTCSLADKRDCISCGA